MSHAKYERYGDFDSVRGMHERALAFRIDDPNEIDAKIIVCGICVDSDLTNDGRISAGFHRCEQCGESLGRSEAHSAAIAKQQGSKKEWCE